MKRLICVLIMMSLICLSTGAFAASFNESLSSLGNGIASAAKEFGSQFAEATGQMFESVKESFNENAPVIADGIADGLRNWVKETAPKVNDFAKGLMDKIRLWR